MSDPSTNPFTAATQPATPPRVFRPEGSRNFLSVLIQSKVILIVLCMVVLVELFVVYKYLQKAPEGGGVGGDISDPLKTNQVLPVSVGPLGSAKIALVSEKENYGVGETVSILVRVFTGGYFSDGVDLLLKYDPKVLEASSSAIIAGSSFPNYPIKEIDSQKGLVKISAISGTTEGGFNGVGNLAILNFKAKAVGKSDLSVEFTDNSTSESNVIIRQDAQDILTEVSGVTINIGSSAKPSQENISCATKSYQNCVDLQGKSGSFWCTSITDSASCQVGCFKLENSDDLGCNVVTTD